MNRYVLAKQKTLAELCKKKDEENEKLNARIAELEAEVFDMKTIYVRTDVVHKMEADAIRDAIKVGLANKNFPWHWSVVKSVMLEYADNLERGES